MTSRAILLALFGLGLLLHGQGEPARLETTAAAFGESVAAKMHLLVCEMALLDTKTLAERTPEREALLAEQERLERWFDSHDRDVSLAELTTTADKENYRAFRRVMANRAFIQLPYAERRAFVETSDAHFRAMARAMPATLAAMSQDDPALRDLLTERTAVTMGIGARWFGRGSETTVAAVYVPFTRSMYLNVSFMHEKPDEFIDAFEHEMWHHLLPLVSRDTAWRNLWWEGCTEASAERFSAELQRRGGLASGRAGHSTEYPVQAAWASLLMAQDPAGAMALWSGAGEADAILARWEARGGLAAVLAAQWRGRLRIDARRQEALEDLLSDWGWKENEGSRINIANLITDGELDPEKVATVFRETRGLLTDLADAMSVLYLQELRRSYDAEVLLAGGELPPVLRENLRQVLIYSQKPRRVFRRIDYERR